MFHHDQSHTGVSPDTKWGASRVGGLTVKWQQLVGGGAHGTAGVFASPVVAYNATLAKTVVYGISVVGMVHAFDAATGATIWTYDVGAAVVNSPALDGNSLYFGTSRGQLIALDATTGAMQCSFQQPTVPPETVPGRIQSSPVVGHIDATGPVVFFGDEGESEKLNAGHEWAVTGFDNSAGDCQLKWSFNDWANKGAKGLNTGTWSSPTLSQDNAGKWVVVLGSSNPDDSVYELKADDGTELWHFQTMISAGDEDVGAGPAIGAPGVNGFADGVVYINGKDKIEYALDLLTGSQIWSFDMAADAGLKANSVSTGSLIGDEVVLGYSKYVYDLNATTGAKRWRTAGTTGDILASTAISGTSGAHVAFIGDVAGTFNAYRLRDGALAYSMNVGSQILASAAISYGMVFMASRGGLLYALG